MGRMKLSEFLTVYTFARMKEQNRMTMEQMNERYSISPFLIPRIYCKDGFNVSIHVHRGAYCASENGTQHFGLKWERVEWGYPSEPLPESKYNPEGSSGYSIGANVSVEIMEELIELHGGIDIHQTLEKCISCA